MTITQSDSVLAWPSGPDKRYLAPWPTIVRRMVFAPLVYAGLGLAFVGLALGWGLDEARRFWRSAR